MNVLEALYGHEDEHEDGHHDEHHNRHPFWSKHNPLVWVLVTVGVVVGVRYLGRSKPSPKRRVKGNPLAFFALEEKRRAEDPTGSGHRMANPPGFCGVGGKQMVSNPDINGFLITDTDSKTGLRLVWTFSLPRGKPADTGGTCVAASPWCIALCYGTGGHYARATGDPAVKRWYGRNYTIARQTVGNPDYFANKMLSALEILGKKKKHPKVMRVHVLGEFFHPDYIKAWIKVAQNARDWNFYAYTRTWVLAKKSAKWASALNELRHQPNFNLLLSTDPSTGPALPGWKECGVDVSYNRKGLICNHAVDSNTTCYACTKCWDPQGPSVYIPVHGATKRTLPTHEQMTAERIRKYGFNPRM